VPPPPTECAKGGFYDFSAKALDDIQTIPMCSYAGKVVLVVNVASKCGYTPQYKPLQALYAKYQEQGLVVLGFPSADFGNQEFADDKDISAFCTTTYGITFPMFSRIDVKGPNQDPIYAWLTKQPGGEGEITWNFNKFLLGRDGVFRQRFATETSPDAAVLTQAVEAALAAP
jgi:glutathione peroxidase